MSILKKFNLSSLSHGVLSEIAAATGGAAVLIGVAVFLSNPLLPLALSPTLINEEGIVLAAATGDEYPQPPSPLKCLWSKQFGSSAVVQGATTSPNCEPTTLVSIFGASIGSGSVLAHVRDNASMRVKEDCSWSWSGYKCKLVFQITHSWQQSYMGADLIMAPGTPADLQWSVQPSQSVGWKGGSCDNFGCLNGPKQETKFKDINFANQTVGTWKSWAGSGVFSAGGLTGAASPPAPVDTTTYTLRAQYDENLGKVNKKPNINNETVTDNIIFVYVDRPVLELTANPSLIGPGGSSDLQWTAHNVKKGSCGITYARASENPQTLAQNLNASKETGKRATGPLFQKTTYTLTCMRYTNITVSVSVDVDVDGTITISAPIPTAKEGKPPTNGKFTIARTGPTTAAVAVGFSMGGTGLRNSDYSLSGAGISGKNGTSVTLPVSGTSIDILVAPRNNNKIPDGEKTAVMSLSADPSKNATVTILDDESSPLVTPLPPNLGLSINIVDFRADPTRVRKGNATTLHWQVAGLVPGNVCFISPEPGGTVSSFITENGRSSGQTAPITSQKMYSFSCAPSLLSPVTVSKMITITLLPAFLEI